MESVSLSTAARTALLQSKSVAILSGRSAERLATGRRVNNALDGVQSFFQARSLSSRASDLLAAKDRINQGANTIGSAIAGTEAIGQLVDQAKALALTAKGGTAAERQVAAEQFDEIRTQINNLARDTSFLGRNLLSSPPGSLTVSFTSDTSSSLTISGVATDAAGLGIASAVAVQNSFVTDADIDSALAQIDTAVDTLRSTASTLGSNNAILGIREEFTQNLSNILEDGASKLTDADLNEEAANLLSLQVRGELAIVAQNIAQENAQRILDIL